MKQTIEMFIWKKIMVKFEILYSVNRDIVGPQHLLVSSE